MLIRTLCAGMFLVAATAAHADESGAPGTTVSLDDLKAKCADLLANPQMVKPKVKITCNELSYSWSAGKPGAGKLANQRKVGAAIQMKGFTVGHQFFDQAVPDTQIACQTFQRIEKQVHNVDVEQSCEQLADIKDLGAFCAPILDQRASADPSLVEEKPTGEIVSLCPAQ